ncbi:MAG: hypothetical protein ACOYD4_05830 [Solirubrobacterales bacterium]
MLGPGWRFFQPPESTPVVRDFIEADKEYLDLVPAERRAEFRLD